MLINVKFKKMSFFFFLYILYSSATYPPTTLKSQNHKITLWVLRSVLPLAYIINKEMG